MCSLSSTLRYCCVGPAPFDDIWDIPYHDSSSSHRDCATTAHRSPDRPHLPRLETPSNNTDPNTDLSTTQRLHTGRSSEGPHQSEVDGGRYGGPKSCTDADRSLEIQCLSDNVVNDRQQSSSVNGARQQTDINVNNHNHGNHSFSHSHSHNGLRSYCLGPRFNNLRSYHITRCLKNHSDSSLKIRSNHNVKTHSECSMIDSSDQILNKQSNQILCQCLSNHSPDSYPKDCSLSDCHNAMYHGDISAINHNHPQDTIILSECSSHCRDLDSSLEDNLEINPSWYFSGSYPDNRYHAVCRYCIHERGRNLQPHPRWTTCIQTFHSPHSHQFFPLCPTPPFGPPRYAWEDSEEDIEDCLL